MYPVAITTMEHLGTIAPLTSVRAHYVLRLVCLGVLQSII
jgi:hypothetical protein